MIPAMSGGLAHRLPLLRRQAHLTQLLLAFRSGLSLGLIQRIEQNLNTNLSLHSLRCLAGALQVSLVELLGDDAEPLPPTEDHSTARSRVAGASAEPVLAGCHQAEQLPGDELPGASVLEEATR
jgi:transcriptional regulator with XRE-family HTH domain